MSALTTRRQTIIKGPNQIITPDQLREGMPIACLSVFEGTTIRERLGKVAFGLMMRIIDDPNKSDIDDGSEPTNMRRAWVHEDLNGLLPLWRGVFLDHRANGMVRIKKTGGFETYTTSALSYIGKDPSELPTLDEPIDLYATYSNLGLAPVGSDSHPTYGVQSDHGRWERTATIETESS